MDTEEEKNRKYQLLMEMWWLECEFGLRDDLDKDSLPISEERKAEIRKELEELENDK